MHSIDCIYIKRKETLNFILFTLFTSCLHYHGLLNQETKDIYAMHKFLALHSQKMFLLHSGEFFSKYQHSINNLTISYCRGSPDNTAKLVYFMWRPRKCLRNILSQGRFLKQSSASNVLHFKNLLVYITSLLLTPTALHFTKVVV